MTIRRTGSPKSTISFSQTRRSLLKAAPAMLFAPMALAQPGIPVAVRKLHSFGIRVSDVQRSVAFYQDLFAAPIQARQGESVVLRIGDGPRFFTIAPLGQGEQPGITHIGLSVADFDAGSVQRQLRAFGVNPGAAPGNGQSALSVAMQSWVEVRDGGAQDLYFADIEGIRYHLSSEDACGGAGVNGNSCQNVEAAAADGMFELLDLSHFTTFLANRDRANDFYTSTFGKSYQAFQGPGSPVIGVGDGIQFLMYVGGSEAGQPTQPGRIDHVCFSVTDFAVDPILEQLTDYGLTAREDPQNTRPLMHWISMRMPNRGGAEGGTPELYFSDPDGIRVQLQDANYCGGGGYLGDSCPAL